MTLHLHRPHHATAGSDPAQELSAPASRVFAVQRTGAVLVALFLLAFGILGLASGQDFFSTDTRPVLGMSSNGLLSTLSLFVAIVLLVAAGRSPRTASTVLIVLGGLFLLSAVANSFVLGTRRNLLAFDVSNVVFSAAVGLPMLFIGAFGRFSGHLPPDSPYARPASAEEFLDERPRTPEEFAAERAMREAEVAVVQHTATPEQQRRVRAMAQAHTRTDRRRLWMELEAQPPPPDPGAVPSPRGRGHALVTGWTEHGLPRRIGRRAR